jgi:fatty-acyl-CoA synthase
VRHGHARRTTVTALPTGDRSFAAIGPMLVAALRRYPDRTALAAEGESVSYREAEATIARLVALLVEEGARPGDSVVQVGRNRPFQWLVTAACYVGGFRSASLPFQGIAPDVLRRRLVEAEPRVVVADAAATALLGSLVDDLGQVQWWCDGPDSGWRDLAAESRRRSETTVRDIAPGDTVVRLAYTSGTTTGRPRGVLLSSSALCAVAALTLAQLEWPAAPRVLCPEPVGGGFGNMVVPTLTRGGTFIMLDRPDVPTLLSSVETWQPHVLMLMPPTLRSLMSHPAADTTDWSSVALVGYSGAVLDQDEIDAAHRLFGPVLWGIFGQVEAPKTIAVLTADDHVSSAVDRRRNLGLPYLGMTVQVQDLSGREVASGTAGELCVRGATVMNGYLHGTGDAAALRKGWLRTGDVCRIDDSGYIHHIDRLVDVVQSNGVLVCPSDLEETLAASGLSGVAVALRGPDAVVLFAVAGVDTTAATSVLAGVSVEVIGTEVLETLPTNFMGRLDRAALREHWAARSRETA